MAAILRDSYHHVFGAFPTLATLGTAWSQVALEHASGAAVYCHNLGNITTTGGAGDYYVLHVQEQVGPGVWKWMDLKFAAHHDFIDGGRAYWSLLKRRYASVLPLFAAGDADAAARRLRELRYYTADADKYARGMVGLARRFGSEIVPALIGKVEPVPVAVAVDGWAEIVEACSTANWCGARAA
jgi:hypothetical protein